MAILLADVGGTNARLALARNGVIDGSSITRYRGDDYSSFDAVVQTFLAEQENPRLSAVCVAVAGPVSGGVASLTNRDWDFSENRLARLTDADHVRLINDLMALGYATPRLGAEGVSLLRAAPASRSRNGQSLVVGAGTGFNVCGVQTLPGGGISCQEAEEGHTSLPANIAGRLSDRVGIKAMLDFFSTEETFAGRGLARLHTALHGKEVRNSEEISTAAMQGDAEAEETYALFTELFGLLLRELSLRFMPLDGIFLAGSVARSFAHRTQQLEAAFLAEPYMRHIPDNTPLLLIRDDMAALHGCLAAIA
ncbi:glucokinase [Paracoccus aerodenitrificans]|uniref:glucokinase n=1 Tax=Paracoccus aerodenitrificans TaxID=3017781 RepID=UPI0022F04ECA|nr:glucokinase [Paracoccus aerodenitrificans]WBU63842.1 glucokinase [Paracoccus aerodenitrificans]